MPHANATLTELGRLYLAQYHLEQGATLAQTAERFQVSTTTVRRWVGRYRQVLATGRVPRAADMADQSSRPRRSPNRTPGPVERFNRTLLEEWANAKAYTANQPAAKH